MKLHPIALLAFAMLALSCDKLDAVRTRRVPEADLFEPQRVRVRPEMPGRRNVDVTLPDGNVLRGIAATRPEPKAVILYFGGGSEFAQAATNRLTEWAARYNVSVVYIDYRGYGASSGAPSLGQLPADALSVYDRTQVMRRDVPTFVMGFAIGSIPATYLAARRPVAGLVLVAPVSSLDDESLYRPKKDGEPWYIAHFMPTVKTKPGFEIPDDSKPVLQIRQVSAPLLLIHGEADGTVPPQCGRQVYESAKGEKELLMVPKVGHDVSSLLSGLGGNALGLFLSERLGGGSQGEKVVTETIRGSDGAVIVETIEGSD